VTLIPDFDLQDSSLDFDKNFVRQQLQLRHLNIPIDPQHTQSPTVNRSSPSSTSKLGVRVTGHMGDADVKEAEIAGKTRDDSWGCPVRERGLMILLPLPSFPDLLQDDIRQ